MKKKAAGLGKAQARVRYVYRTVMDILQLEGWDVARRIPG